MQNYYDNIKIDIRKQHERLNNDIKLCNPVNPRKNLFRFLIDTVLFKLKLYPKLIDSGFIRGWFCKFNDYWTNILNGRPLRFHDFFYLYSLYRTQFRDIELKNNPSADEIMKTYEQPENIYQIFSCTYIYALSPFLYLNFKQYLKPNDEILEYGCGVAPIATGILTYEKKPYNLTIADIQQFTYHFAKWNLKSLGVKCVDIDPSKLPRLEKYNLIFLNQVLEHLVNPFETVQYLTNHLKKDG